MTATISRPSTTHSGVSSTVLTALVVLAFAVVAAVITVAVMASGSSSDDVPVSPAVYVATAADVFEQRAASSPQGFGARPADLFEQRRAETG